MRVIEVDLARPGRLPAVRGEVLVVVSVEGDVVDRVRVRNWDPLREQCLRQELLDRASAHIHARSRIRPDEEAPAPDPSILSVVVSTQGRPGLLPGCLESVSELDPPAGEVVLVERTPDEERSVPAGVRRIAAPPGGRVEALNAGWRATSGSVVAFLSESARPRGDFAGRLVTAFTLPRVGLATALVIPAELDTYAQLAYERRYRGARGKLRPQLVGVPDFDPIALGVGHLAARRVVLEGLSGFDSGRTVGEGLESELDLVRRAVEAGWLRLHHPRAVVREVHPRTRAALLRLVRQRAAASGACLEDRGSMIARRAVDVLRGCASAALGTRLLDLQLWASEGIGLWEGWRATARNSR